MNYFDVTKTVSGSGTATRPSGFKVTGRWIKTIPTNRHGSTSSDEYGRSGRWVTG